MDHTLTRDAKKALATIYKAYKSSAQAEKQNPPRFISIPNHTMPPPLMQPSPTAWQSCQTRNM